MRVVALDCEGDPQARVDCGFKAIYPADCLSHPECCWDDSIPDVNWCFYGSK